MPSAQAHSSVEGTPRKRRFAERPRDPNLKFEILQTLVRPAVSSFVVRRPLTHAHLIHCVGLGSLRVDAERAVEEAGDEANSPEDRSSPNAQVVREATPGDAKRKLRMADGDGADDVGDGDGGAPATNERRRKKCKTGSPGAALGMG